MRYIEFTEQENIDDFVVMKEISSLEEAEERVISRFNSTKEFPGLSEKYVELFNSNLLDDLRNAKSSGDEDYYCDILKRGLETAGFYVVLKSEESKDPETDIF